MVRAVSGIGSSILADGGGIGQKGRSGWQPTWALFGTDGLSKSRVSCHETYLRVLRVGVGKHLRKNRIECPWLAREVYARVGLRPGIEPDDSVQSWSSGVLRGSTMWFNINERRNL